MRGQSKSPVRPSNNNARGGVGMENHYSFEWLIHLYLEWNPYRSVLKIKEIIDTNSSKFKKIVVYAKSDQTAK